MTTNTNPPVPADLGAPSHQSAGPTDAMTNVPTATNAGGLRADPTSVKILELVEDQPQLLSTLAAKQIIGTYQHQLSLENALLRAELDAWHKEQLTLNTKIARQDGTINLLQDQLTREIRTKTPRTILATVGTSLLLLGLDNFSKDLKVAVSLTLFGAALLFSTHLLGIKERDVK